MGTGVKECLYCSLGASPGKDGKADCYVLSFSLFFFFPFDHQKKKS